MRWGIENEKKAQDLYVKRMIEQGCHQHFRFEQCGFFINPLYPFFGASPDGMRYCACHGCGCVEVKCPATKASLTIDESCQDPTFCLEKIGDEIKLKTTQQYYMQVQMQIFVTNADFCDFVVRTTKDMFVQRIEPDFDFWQEMVPKMQHFVEVAILPELVGQWFSRPQPQVLQVSPRKVSDDGKKMNTADGTFCYCSVSEGRVKMIWWPVTMKTAALSGLIFSVLALNPHQRAAGSVLTVDSFQNSTVMVKFNQRLVRV